MSLNSEDISIIIQLKTILEKMQMATVLGIFPVGFLLNTIIILVFMRKTFRSNSMGVCNIIISITNNIILIFNFGMYYTDSYGTNVLVMSDFFCVLFYYSTRVFSSFHSWLIVMFSFNRLTYLAYPFRFKFMRKKLFLCVASLVLFVINAILFLPNFYYSVKTSSIVSNQTNATLIVKTCGSTAQIEALLDYIRMGSRIIIPVVLVILMDFYLIYKLEKTKSKVKSSTSSRKEYHFSKSIAALSIFFVVSLLPFLIILIFRNVFIKQINSSYKLKSIIDIAGGVSIFIASYNYCFMFFVNLKFNRLFRDEVVYLVKKFKFIFGWLCELKV